MDKPELTRTTVDGWMAQKIGIPLAQVTPAAVEAWQLERLRQSLTYAKAHSVFYREHLKDITTNCIVNKTHLSQIPLMSENDVRGNEWALHCVSPRQVIRLVTVPTTGTTGAQKRIAFTQNDMAESMDFMQHGLQMMVQPHERILVLMAGGSIGSIGDTVQRAVASRDISVQTLGPIQEIATAYDAVLSYRPHLIIGIPCQLAALARYGAKFHNKERAFINSVIMSSDDVPNSVVKRLEQAWGCKVFRHYGTTELCMAAGVECSAGNGYHLRDCDMLFEVIHPDVHGYGEIVVTTLGREAMPFIRYATGDIGKIDTAPCSCGSPFPRIAHILGRKKNQISWDGISFFLSQIADALYSVEQVADFDCTVTSTGIQLQIKLLEEDVVSPQQILSALLEVPQIALAHQHGMDIQQSHSTITKFPSVYNQKKEVLYQ